MARTPEEIEQDLWDSAIETELVTAGLPTGTMGKLFKIIASELVDAELYYERSEEKCDLARCPSNYEDQIESLSSPFHFRTPAKQSYVIVRITRDDNGTGGDISIPIGTIIEEAAENPAVYQTIEAKILYDGLDTIDVVAISLEAGTHTMVAEDQLTIIELDNVTCTNPEASWGGEDQEPIDECRRAALTARYEYERGTQYAIDRALQEYGLESWEYNLVEYKFGYGTGGLYLDTTITQVVEEVQEIVDESKAHGVYIKVYEANRLPFSFEFETELALEKDLLPDERDRLKVDMEEAFRRFVLENGVGKKIIMSKIIHQIYEELLDNYELADIEISTDDYPGKVDSKGNIVLEVEEVVDIQSVSINFTVG